MAKVADSTGLSRKLVDRTYKAFWMAVRMHIKSLPLKDDLDEEGFSRLQPNVNIPSIGKLYVTYDRYQRIKRQSEIKLEKLKLKEGNNVKDKVN